jgi:hypothetical protein
MKPNWDNVLAGNIDPMAGRARFRATIREPRRATEFLPTLRRHFFSGHLWSSLVICDAHSDRQIGPPDRFLERFWTDSFRQDRAEVRRRRKLQRRRTPTAYRPPPTAFPGARPKPVSKRDKKCQIVPKSATEGFLSRNTVKRS